MSHVSASGMPVENNSPSKRENRPKRNGKRQNFRPVIICHRRPEIFKLGFDPALKFASGSSTMTSCCQCVHRKFATMAKSYGSDNRAGCGSRDPGTQPQLCSPIGHLCETQLAAIGNLAGHATDNARTTMFSKCVYREGAIFR